MWAFDSTMACRSLYHATLINARPLHTVWNTLWKVSLPFFCMVGMTRKYVFPRIVSSNILPGWVAPCYPSNLKCGGRLGNQHHSCRFSLHRRFPGFSTFASCARFPNPFSHEAGTVGWAGHARIRFCIATICAGNGEVFFVFNELAIRACLLSGNQW